MNLFLSLLQYLRYPVRVDHNEPLEIGVKLGNSVKIISWLYAIAFVVAVLIDLFPAHAGANKVSEVLGAAGIGQILLLLIFETFFEELAFRLWMRYTQWSIVLGWFFFYGLSMLICLQTVSFPAWVENNVLAVTLVSDIVCTTILSFIIHLQWQKVEAFLTHWFYMLFYLSAVIFGVYHFSNYTSLTLSFSLPFLVTIQIIGGLLFGYVRLHYGFMYGYLTHFIYDFLLSMVALIADQGLLGHERIPSVIILILFVSMLLWGIGSMLSYIFILIRKHTFSRSQI